MAYTKRFRTVIPADADTDIDVLRWLTRESFDRTAAGENLRIVEYSETELDPADIPPKIAKQLPRPIAAYTWHQFAAVASA